MHERVVGEDGGERGRDVNERDVEDDRRARELRLEVVHGDDQAGK